MSLSLAWCFFLHFLGDFVLQSRWMAENKSSNWRALGAHIGVIFGVFLLGTLSLPLALGNALVHAAIDRNIWNGYKWWRRDEGPSFAFQKDHFFWVVLGLDQLFHALTIIFLVEWLR